MLGAAGCGVKASGDSSASGTGVSGGTTKTTSVVVEKPTNFEGTGGVVYLNKAAEATAAVDTQKVDMKMAIEASGLTMNVNMDGAMDVKNNQAQLNMTMSGIPGLDSGSSGGLTMEMVMDGDTVYVKSPMLSQLSGSSKPWMSTTSEDFSGEGMGSTQTNPKAFLEFLKNSGSDVTEVGTEEVRGVKTTHLKTTLDTKAIVDKASGDAKGDMEKQLDELGATGFDKIPVEAWVDGDGYVRKLVMDMSGKAEGQSMSMTMTMELYDFNEPVEITIPDASQVQEAPAGTFGN
jgi:hypothetical protein